jgi:hypothetical protein
MANKTFILSENSLYINKIILDNMGLHVGRIYSGK